MTHIPESDMDDQRVEPVPGWDDDRPFFATLAQRSRFAEEARLRIRREMIMITSVFTREVFVYVMEDQPAYVVSIRNPGEFDEWLTRNPQYARQEGEI